MIGETISHYRVLSEIGAGGMGVVYKAEDLRLGRFVALKFLPTQLVRDEDARRRLFAEARAASSLDHPNVCTIYDVEELPDGRVFLAMAFCDGETLKERLERGVIPTTEAVRLAAQIARGLARAHQAGIVHRDVKPGNIMVTTDGDAKLLDFGIAKASGGVDMTRTGTTVGTVAYMAPEHVRGGTADARSDVWSLGVVLYEMLAGRHPFTGGDNYELLTAIVERPVPPLPSDVPPPLAGIVSRALDRNANGRFATCRRDGIDARAVAPGCPDDLRHDGAVANGLESLALGRTRCGGHRSGRRGGRALELAVGRRGRARRAHGCSARSATARGSRPERRGVHARDESGEGDRGGSRARELVAADFDVDQHQLAARRR